MQVVWNNIRKSKKMFCTFFFIFEGERKWSLKKKKLNDDEILTVKNFKLAKLGKLVPLFVLH